MYRVASKPTPQERNFSITVQKRGKLARGEQRSSSFSIVGPEQDTAEKVMETVRASLDTQQHNSTPQMVGQEFS